MGRTSPPSPGVLVVLPVVDEVLSVSMEPVLTTTSMLDSVASGLRNPEWALDKLLLDIVYTRFSPDGVPCNPVDRSLVDGVSSILLLVLVVVVSWSSSDASPSSRSSLDVSGLFIVTSLSIAFSLLTLSGIRVRTPSQIRLTKSESVSIDWETVLVVATLEALADSSTDLEDDLPLAYEDLLDVVISLASLYSVLLYCMNIAPVPRVEPVFWLILLRTDASGSMMAPVKIERGLDCELAEKLVADEDEDDVVEWLLLRSSVDLE